MNSKRHFRWFGQRPTIESEPHDSVDRMNHAVGNVRRLFDLSAVIIHGRYGRGAERLERIVHSISFFDVGPSKINSRISEMRRTARRNIRHKLAAALRDLADVVEEDKLSVQPPDIAVVLAVQNRHKHDEHIAEAAQTALNAFPDTLLRSDDLGPADIPKTSIEPSAPQPRPYSLRTLWQFVRHSGPKG
jgi:hypothetical protein